MKNKILSSMSLIAMILSVGASADNAANKGPKGIYEQVLTCTGTVTEGTEAGAVLEITLLSKSTPEPTPEPKCGSGKSMKTGAALFIKTTLPAQSKLPADSSVLLGVETLKENTLKFLRTDTYRDSRDGNETLTLSKSVEVDLKSKTGTFKESDSLDGTITTQLSCESIVRVCPDQTLKN